MYVHHFEQELGSGIMTNIPAYLAEPSKEGYIYGTLEYERYTGYWVIRGEPCVVTMAKRLFPGSQGNGRGIAKFKANKRTIGDLNWLMLRYPLRILDEKLWEQHKKEAVHHVIEREKINLNPVRVEPPEAFFGELREFQKEGVGFLKVNRRTLLADDMGLGKTIQALAFLCEINAFPSIIVVQPHLVGNWKAEIARFLRLPSNSGISKQKKVEHGVHVISGLKPYKLPKAHLYIIHYGLLRGWKNELLEYKFEAVVFDEIQDLRHAGTEKYSAASLLAGSVETVIGLSGTPIYNRGGEIWNVLNIIDYHCLGDWDSFTREWCVGYGSDTVQDPELLHDYLKREGLLLRRTKDQVLHELPQKIRSVQYVDADEGVYSELIRTTMQKIAVYENSKDQFEKGRLMRDIVNSARQATGIAKAPEVCMFVRALLDDGNRVILFAYHHAVFDIYGELLAKYNPVRISGRETAKEKLEAEKAFMEGKTDLILVSLRACAGLNLQRATCVVFGELDWSPAIHSQAEDRAHRIGQKDSVLCYYLVSKEGSDQDIQDALGLKISQFVGIMGDRVQSEEDRMLEESKARQYMQQLVERLKKGMHKNYRQEHIM